MIPFAAVIRWHHAHNRNHHMWLPLFLLWLILLPLLLVLFPVVLLAGLFLGINAGKLYVSVWQILTAMRNTLIEVEDSRTSLHIRII